MNLTNIRKGIEIEAQRQLAQKLIALEKFNKEELLKRIAVFETTMKETIREVVCEELRKQKDEFF